MAGLMQLKSKIKRLTKACKVALEGPIVSVVHMDTEGNILWEDGVNYNDGLLVVPNLLAICRSGKHDTRLSPKDCDKCLFWLVRMTI